MNFLKSGQQCIMSLFKIHMVKSTIYHTLAPYIDKMYTKLYELFGRFIPLDENDKQILQERFKTQSVKKKHQLLEYG